MNDGVVDAQNLHPKQPIFNLSRPLNNINNQNNNNAPKSRAPYAPRRKFTPLGKPLEITLRNNLITLPEARDYEPKVKLA